MTPVDRRRDIRPVSCTPQRPDPVPAPRSPQPDAAPRSPRPGTTAWPAHDATAGRAGEHQET